MKLKTKNWKLKTLLSLALLLFLSANAFAISDMKAKIKVSGGNTYDYFIFGMMTDATDGFDNAYDTISPGPNMNDTYISTYFSHPEWNAVKSEFRADFRSIKESDEWTVSVYTNLAAGTALTMALQSEGSNISGYSLTVEDTTTGQMTDILSSTYGFTVSAGNPLRYFRITATSTAQPCTYTISPTSQSFGSSGGTGTVSVTASSSSCGWTVASNVSWLTITSGSSGTGSGTVNYSVAANNDTSLRIGAITIAGQTFTVTQDGIPQVPQYTLTVSKSGTGSGTVTATGINCGSDCSETYNSGTSVTLTATAATGSTFAGWSGACTGTGTCTVTMNTAKSVTAAFSLKTYTITATAGSGGSISPSGTISVNYGSSQTFAITPNTNYSISDVMVDGASAGAVSSYTFGNVTANHIISASFSYIPPSSGGGGGAPSQYDLTITKSGNGTVTANTGTITWSGNTGTASYSSGTSVTLTAAANTNSTFTGWSGACTGTGTCTVTMDATKSVTAIFAVCTYSISPASQSFDSGGGNDTVNVTSQSGCSWTVTSNVSWITITSSGSSSSGNGVVNYSVSSNSSTSSRTGTMTIAGQTFTVTQSGISCTYSISPTSTVFSRKGGTGNVSVTTSDGCNWTATSNVKWIKIVSGNNGSGNGTVRYRVLPNTGKKIRTGTITIAGQTFTVTQRIK